MTNNLDVPTMQGLLSGAFSNSSQTHLTAANDHLVGATLANEPRSDHNMVKQAANFGGPGGGGMEARIATLEADMGHVKRDVTDLRADVRVLQSDVTSIKVDVATLKEAVSHLPDKDWVSEQLGKQLTKIGLLVTVITGIIAAAARVIGG